MHSNGHQNMHDVDASQHNERLHILLLHHGNIKAVGGGGGGGGVVTG